MRALYGIMLAVPICWGTQQAAARTIVECVDAEGNSFFSDKCPPEATKKDEKHLLGVGPKSDPAIGAAALAYPITVYTIPECDACDLIRQSLRGRGIPFTELDVQDNAERQTAMQHATGGLTVPSVTVGEKVVTGYSREGLDQALKAAGYPLDSGDARATGLLLTRPE